MRSHPQHMSQLLTRLHSHPGPQFLSASMDLTELAGRESMRASEPSWISHEVLRDRKPSINGLAKEVSEPGINSEGSSTYSDDSIVYPESPQPRLKTNFSLQIRKTMSRSASGDRTVSQPTLLQVDLGRFRASRHLYSAIMTDNLDMVRYILYSGADPNVLAHANKKRNKGITPLFVAINRNAAFSRDHKLAARQRSNLEIIKSLLNSRADVNQPGPEGQFPLMAACTIGSSQIVSPLLQHNADIKLVSRYTPNLNNIVHLLSIHHNPCDSVDTLPKYTSRERMDDKGHPNQQAWAAPTLLAEQLTSSVTISSPNANRKLPAKTGRIW